MVPVRSGRSKWKTAMVTTVVGAASVVAIGVGIPALAASADGSTTPAQAVSDRLTKIKDALSGLVKDGTISQKQADKVASTLDSRLPRAGDGFHGPQLGRLMGEVDGLAKTLKLTSAQLLTQLRSGKTLAQIATARGVPTGTVIKQIVADVTARLDAAVKAGRITQTQARQIEADLTQRVTAFVDNGGPFRGMAKGMGMGDGGMGGGMRPGSGQGWGGGNGTPSTAPSGSGST